MKDKQKLILLPGWGCNELVWQHQSYYLKECVNPEVIIPTQNTIEKMADEIVTTVPGKIILAGHSLGGWIAQYIAIHYPEKISQLILLSTWTGVSSAKFIAFMKHAIIRIGNDEVGLLLNEIRPRLVHPERKNEVTLLEQIKMSQKLFSTQELINQTLAEINSNDTLSLLHKIQCQTLLIYGRQDSYFSIEEQQTIKNKIPNAKLAIIENCGHMPTLERPEATTALMRFWIEYFSN